MIVEKSDEKHKSAINNYIKENFAGPVIVTKANVIDTSKLPSFVVLENYKLASALVYKENTDDIEIVCLFSIIENRGYATALLDEIISFAKTKNKKRVWLITTNDNTQAIRFYQKYGFELKAVYIDALDESRKLKPEIPCIGEDNIPIKHEFEFEINLRRQ